MAGRPLRRMRNALWNNPLTGWENTSDMTPAKAEMPFVVMLKPNARDTFLHEYRNTALPIAIALRPTARHAGDTYSHLALAKKLNSLLVVVRVRERSEYSEPVGKRGEIDRISPYTPFVVLHRVGDQLRNQAKLRKAVGPGGVSLDNEVYALVTELDNAEHLLYARLAGLTPEQYKALHPWDEARKALFRVQWEIFSRGVDTAAGRMGVIADDYMSDLFAKYVLTGKVAYDPVNPLPSYAGEAEFRQTVARIAPKLLQGYVRSITRAIPAVIYI
jgi:hypothetical protein